MIVAFVLGVVLIIIGIVGLFSSRETQGKWLMFGKRWKYKNEDTYSDSYFIFLKVVDVALILVGGLMIFLGIKFMN